MSSISLNFPSGWSITTLEKISLIEMGQSPDSRFYNNQGKGFPFFQGKAEFQAVFPEIRKWTTIPTKIVEYGDILLSIRAPVGPTNIAPQRSCIGRGLAAIRAENGVNQKYIFYFLKNIGPWLAEQGTGSTFAAISSQFVKSLSIPIAPLNEQTRIVEKLEELLSDLDAGVAELKAAQKKLEQYRQSLLKAAVEGSLTAEWRQHNTVKETGAQLLQRILTERRAHWEAKQLAKLKEQGKTPPKDWQKKYPEPVQPDTSNLPELPEGWVWATIDQLAFVVRGASPRPAGDPKYFGGNIPWITVGSITRDDGIYIEHTEQFITEAGKQASRFVDVGTLLLTNSGATLGVPKITRIGGCINDGSVALLYLDETTKLYLYWFLKTQTEHLRALNQGAAQPNLNTDIVRRITVPICSQHETLEIIKVINLAIDSSNNQESSTAIALKQSAAQRKNILKAAFSGQLVPQDPNDEPASLLLERIRAEREKRDAIAKPRKSKTRKI